VTDGEETAVEDAAEPQMEACGGPRGNLQQLG